MAFPADVILYSPVPNHLPCMTAATKCRQGQLSMLTAPWPSKFKVENGHALLSAEGFHTRWAENMPSENMSLWQFFFQGQRNPLRTYHGIYLWIYERVKQPTRKQRKNTLYNLYICIKRTWFFWPSLIEEEPYFTIIIIIFLGFLIIIFCWH